MVLYDVNGEILTSSQFLSKYPDTYYVRRVSDGSAPGEHYYINGEKVKKATVQLTETGAQALNPTPPSNEVNVEYRAGRSVTVSKLTGETASSYPELGDDILKAFSNEPYHVRQAIEDKIKSKEYRLELGEKLGIDYNPPANFGTNTEVTLVKKTEQIVRDDTGKIIGTLGVPEQTYEQRYKSATGSLPGQEPKPIFTGIEQPQSVLPPAPIVKTTTPINNVNQFGGLSISAAPKPKGLDWLSYKAQQFSQYSTQLDFKSNKSPIEGLKQAGFFFGAITLQAGATLGGVVRHPIKTGVELVTFPYEVVKSSVGGQSSLYGIGDQIRQDPALFVGEQAGYGLAFGGFHLGANKVKTSIAKHTTYELNIPVSDYTRTRGKGGVNPTLGKAEKLNVNVMETSPVKVNRGGTFKRYIQVGEKKLFEKTISKDAGVIQVGNKAYVNLPVNKFQMQTLVSGTGKIPIKTYVGKQPVNSLRMETTASTATPKPKLKSREILSELQPAGRVEINTGKEKLIYPEFFKEDFNTRMAAQETYIAKLQSINKRTNKGRTQTESVNIETSQLIHTKAIATPGVTSKKGYIDGQLKATSKEITPTKFVFEDNFKYQKDKLIIEERGNTQAIGKIKAPSMKQQTRGDAYTQGMINVIDAPTKKAKAPKLSKTWRNILERAEKSNQKARADSKIKLDTVTDTKLSLKNKPAKTKVTSKYNIPMLSKLMKPKKGLKIKATSVTTTNTAQNPRLNIGTNTRPRANVGTLIKPRQNSLPVSISDTKSSSIMQPKSSYKTETSPLFDTSFISKQRIRTIPDTKISTFPDTKITQIYTKPITGLTSVPKIGTPITTPIIPGPIIPPTPSNDWDFNPQKQRKKQPNSYKNPVWSGRYTASIEAAAFNIHGKRSKLGTKSGLTIRPL